MFKYNCLVSFPHFLPPPPLYIHHLIFSPCCVISALYITAAHSSTPLFFIYLFVTSSSFLFPASLPPSPHTSFFLYQYFFSYTSLPYIIFLHVYPLFFKIFELLIIFSYLDGMETILLPYFVERVVSVLLSVHCITTSAPFV